MASRAGTYLSDENVKNMCVIDKTSPGSKTYALYKLANSNQRAQRAQNVSNAMLQMSKLQNIPYKTLVQNYQDSIRNIPNESILVYTPSTRIPQSVLEARGRVTPVESIVRPAGTDISSRPLVQGASVVLGTAQPVEGNLGFDVSVNTPTPSRTTRGQLLAEQQIQSKAITPLNDTQRARVIVNVNNIREGKGAYFDLVRLNNNELATTLEKLGGQYTGQKKELLVRQINELSITYRGVVEGQRVKEQEIAEKVGPSIGTPVRPRAGSSSLVEYDTPLDDIDEFTMV